MKKQEFVYPILLIIISLTTVIGCQKESNPIAIHESYADEIIALDAANDKDCNKLIKGKPHLIIVRRLIEFIFWLLGWQNKLFLS